MQNNPNLIFDKIRQQMKLNGLDINNICCDAEIMKFLTTEKHQDLRNIDL